MKYQLKIFWLKTLVRFYDRLFYASGRVREHTDNKYWVTVTTLRDTRDMHNYLKKEV